MQRLTPDPLLPETCRRPVLVLGCGNRLFGDDGVGPAVVERLGAEGLGREGQACLVDAGTAARRVLFDVALSPVRPRAIVVVDAVDAGRAPGEVFTLPLDELPEDKVDDFSMHQVPTSNLLRELRDLCGVEVEIVSCQVAAVPQTVRPGLSAEAEEALPELCRLVRERVEHHVRTSSCRARGPVAGAQRSTPAG